MKENSTKIRRKITGSRPKRRPLSNREFLDLLDRKAEAAGFTRSTGEQKRKLLIALNS